MKKKKIIFILILVSLITNIVFVSKMSFASNGTTVKGNGTTQTAYEKKQQLTKGNIIRAKARAEAYKKTNTKTEVTHPSQNGNASYGVNSPALSSWEVDHYKSIMNYQIDNKMYEIDKAILNNVSQKKIKEMKKELDELKEKRQSVVDIANSTLGEIGQTKIDYVKDTVSKYYDEYKTAFEKGECTVNGMMKNNDIRNAYEHETGILGTRYDSEALILANEYAGAYAGYRFFLKTLENQGIISDSEYTDINNMVFYAVYDYDNFRDLLLDNKTPESMFEIGEYDVDSYNTDISVALDNLKAICQNSLDDETVQRTINQLESMKITMEKVENYNEQQEKELNEQINQQNNEQNQQNTTISEEDRQKMFDAMTLTALSKYNKTAIEETKAGLVYRKTVNDYAEDKATADDVKKAEENWANAGKEYINAVTNLNAVTNSQTDTSNTIQITESPVNTKDVAEKIYTVDEATLKKYIANLYKNTLQREATESELIDAYTRYTESGKNMFKTIQPIVLGNESYEKNGQKAINTIEICTNAYKYIIGTDIPQNTLTALKKLYDQTVDSNIIIKVILNSSEFEQKINSFKEVNTVKPAKRKLDGIKYGEKDAKLGDVNRDGVIDISDANIVLAYISDLSAGFDMSDFISVKKYGDCNGDGKISTIDAAWMLRYYCVHAVGLIPEDSTMEYLVKIFDQNFKMSEDGCTIEVKK